MGNKGPATHPAQKATPRKAANHPTQPPAAEPARKTAWRAKTAGATANAQSPTGPKMPVLKYHPEIKAAESVKTVT